MVVTDNLDGTLSVSYNYATEKGEAEEITFVNLYEEPETTPETGDDSKVGLWIALFFVSGGTLVGAGIYKKRKSN